MVHDDTPTMFGREQGRLRQARQLNGWAGQRLIEEAAAWLQARTARPWSLSRAAYSDWENGKQQIPYPWMVAFSHVLGRSFPELGWPMGFGASVEDSRPETCELCGGRSDHSGLVAEEVSFVAWPLDSTKERAQRYAKGDEDDVSGSTPDVDDTGDRPVSDQEQATKRRDALKRIGALPVLLAETAAESRVLSRREEASDLGPATLEHAALAVEAFGLSYLQIQPQRLFSQVRACRRQLIELLEGRHTLAQRRELYVLLGWLSGLLGHLSLDLGDELGAGTHCVTAYQLARDAGHQGLEAWVRGTQVMVSTYSGDPRRAVAFAEAGLELAPEKSVSRARLAAQQARAYARLGDADLTSKSLQVAEDSLMATSEPVTTSIFSFDAPYLPFYAGTSNVWIGRFHQARQHAERAIELCDAAPADWPVARALARVDLAIALVKQDCPEIERACELGAEALALYSERRVRMIVRRTAELRALLLAERSLPAVVGFDERMVTAERLALPAPQ
jgi:tetratricopeptide (TPR) repeat protein